MPGQESLGSRIGRSAVIVGLGAALLLLFSTGREILVASRFGLSPDFDAFVMALILPTLVTGLLQSIVRLTVIPVYTDHVTRSEEEGNRFFSAMMSVTFIILIIVTIVLVLLAPILLRLLAPGFDQQRYQTAVFLLRISSPLILFSGLSIVIGSVLNARKQFFIPSFVQMMAPAAVVSLLLTFPKAGITLLAIANLTGFFAVFALLYLASLRMGIVYRPMLRAGGGGIRRVAKGAFPLLIGAFLLHNNVVVDNLFASTLTGGSVAALNYAMRINNMTIFLIADSLSSSIFPFFSDFAVKKDYESLRRILDKAIAISSFLIIPATVILSFFAKPLIQTVLQRGAFDEKATQMTSLALVFYLLGTVLTLGTGWLLPRVLNAVEAHSAIMWTSLIGFILNVLLDFLLMRVMGHSGIALSTSLVMCASFLFLLLFVRRKVGKIDLGAQLRRVLRTLLWSVASCITGLLIFWVGILFNVAHPIALAAGIAWAILSFLLTSLILRFEEVTQIVQFARSGEK